MNASWPDGVDSVMHQVSKEVIIRILQNLVDLETLEAKK
jgi:hypothetical protein